MPQAYARIAGCVFARQAFDSSYVHVHPHVCRRYVRNDEDEEKKEGRINPICRPKEAGEMLDSSTIRLKCQLRKRRYMYMRTCSNLVLTEGARLLTAAMIHSDRRKGKNGECGDIVRKTCFLIPPTRIGINFSPSLFFWKTPTVRNFFSCQIFLPLFCCRRCSAGGRSRSRRSQERTDGPPP